MDQEKHEQMSTRKPVGEFLDTFYGGAEGDVGQFVLRQMKRNLLIEDVGGVPTYSGYDIEKAGKIFSEDKNLQAQMMQVGIDFSSRNIQMANEALAKNPNDQKAAEAKQKASQAQSMFVAGMEEATSGRFESPSEIAAREAEAQAKIDEREDKQSARLEEIKLQAKLRGDKAPTAVRPGTKDERKTLELVSVAKDIQNDLENGAATPEDIYSEGYRMNDDGTLFTKRITGAAVELPPFTEAMGKRGGPKALRAAGEYYDDAMELRDLLLKPEVANDLRSTNIGQDADLWDRTKGTVANRVRAWASKHGISEDSDTVTALRRIQRLASEERLKFLGSAVTGTELESTLGWMLNPGDSYEAMMNKVNLTHKEAKQEFKRFIDIYRNIANMTPWYEHFGLNRFEGGRENISPQDMSDEELLRELSK
ncbi:MAG: hypothetical protein ACYSR9_15495 [Planctomycetota bacterium]